MKTIQHLARFLLRLDQPASQVTDAELAVLCRHCANARLAVEIGCFEGRTTAELALAMHSGTLCTIDPFFSGRLGVCWSELIARAHCRRKGATNVRFLQGLSCEMTTAVPNNIDFLFIDGDHSYEGVVRDWNDWFPKVRPGGIIALHDSLIAPHSPERLGSTRFYEETLLTLPTVRLLETEGCLAVFEKRSPDETV